MFISSKYLPCFGIRRNEHLHSTFTPAVFSHIPTSASPLPIIATIPASSMAQRHAPSFSEESEVAGIHNASLHSHRSIV